MSEPLAPRLDVVRREQKEARLREFLLRQLGLAGEGAPATEKAATSCLLIARSADSPAARIVLALGAQAMPPSFSVRAIFAQLGGTETARIAEACRNSNWAIQVRWARDVRLLEAHEQLVLGSATSWIGDCMRREPTARDACELYAADCRDATRRATLFFERLWGASEPVFERRELEAGIDGQQAPMRPDAIAAENGGSAACRLAPPRG